MNSPFRAGSPARLVALLLPLAALATPAHLYSQEAHDMAAEADPGVTGGGASAAEPLSLFDFGAVDAGKFVARQAVVEAKENAVQITFEPSEKFPDVTFPEPSGGTYDLSKYGAVAIDVTNLGSEEQGVSLRVDNPEPPTRKAWNQGGAKIPAGETRTIKVVFGKLPNGKDAYPLDPSKVSAIHLFVARPNAEVKILATNLRALDTPVAGAAEGAAAPAGGGLRTPANPVSGPVLADFEGAEALKDVSGLASTRTLIDQNGSKAVKVETSLKNPYPSVIFKAPAGGWNLLPYTKVLMDVTNLSPESIQFGGRVDNAGASGRANSNTGGVSLNPGETGTLVVDIDRYFAEDLREKLIGMHWTPWGKRGEYGGRLDPGNVVQVSVFLNKPARPATFAVDNIRAEGSYTEPKVPEPFFPFIDKYGQYMHQEWVRKVKSDADFAVIREEEAKSIHDFPRPKDWNTYGGWTGGPDLGKSANFRTAKHEGKWYLVDPDGHLFFSVGMDVVQIGGTTPIERREGWFANAPWENEASFDKFVTTKKAMRGDYSGEVKTYDFYSANMVRKYGEDYETVWLDLMPKRLMNWGFNTIANWSEPKLLKVAGMPYTHWVFYWAPSKLPKQPGTRNQVPDPFDPGLEDAITKAGERMLKGTTDDPNCIGYFVDNELSWGEDDYLALGVLKASPQLYAKQELVKDLQAKYGEIAKLNSAWGMDFADWEALLKNDKAPKSETATADLTAFNEKLVNRYFEVVAGAMKKLAPDKLYLGCRFAEHNAQVVKAAAKYCDVVSFNIYRETVEQWKPIVDIDKPVVIGEFHFGTNDRGVWGKGLRGAATTEERAEKYLRYVTGAARNPVLVGTHYFALTDESTTGRTQEGENHGFGFLSVTDTPYPEMIEASRKAATELYQTRAGASLATGN